MRTAPRSPLAGLLVAGLSVATTTAIIFALRPHVPVLATGVLYLLGVLLVSSRYGLWLGLLTSVASAVAFNFFHIPPTGHLAIHNLGNWLGLGVYLAAAVVVSWFSGAARTRAEEAELGRREARLSAELALIVLGVDPGALSAAADRIAGAFGIDDVALVDGWVDGDAHRRAIPLVAEGERVGTLLVARDADAPDLEQLVPALGALLEARRRRATLEEQTVETKALRRSDTLKTALLRAVSHDLRSPLTAIRAAAGGLDSPTIDAGQRRELAEVIATESDRLTRLIDDLLDLSRLESGTAEPHPEPCLVEEVVEAAAASGRLRSANIDVKLAADLPAVQADPGQLERVISNLLENAVHYSDNGDPVAVRGDASAERVYVRITDHGPGIPADQIERIFDPFYRGADAGNGSGLGLAIARGFVEAGGGRLWVRSLPGQGSTFTIDLPAA